MISKRFTILILCVVCVFTLIMSGYTSENESETKPENETDAVAFDDSVPLYLNGIKVADGYKIGDTTYASVRSFSEALCEDIDINWDEETQTVSLSYDDLEFSATVGKVYICANDRYMLVGDGIKAYEDSVMVPIRTLAKILGAEIDWHDESESISIISDELQMIESADTFYNEDDLYWLSHLINSEAGNQVIEGKIAVGNVVLNRVASPICPDNIHDVIFDNRYGAQFSVVPTGAIYMEPNEESVIAAKICLEGESIIADDCIYFVNPIIGASAWFTTTRTFIGSFGEHDFYA